MVDGRVTQSKLKLDKPQGDFLLAPPSPSKHDKRPPSVSSKLGGRKLVDILYQNQLEQEEEDKEFEEHDREQYQNIGKDEDALMIKIGKKNNKHIDKKAM